MVTFPISVAPGQSVQVPISFTPTAEDARSGNALVYSNAPGSPAVCALTGTGIAIPPYPPEDSTITYEYSANFYSDSSLVVSLPAGNAGDLLVVVLGGGASSGAFTAPAGWTIQHQYTDQQHLMFAYKVREAGEASPTFTRSTTTLGVFMAFNITATERVLPTQIDDSSQSSETTPQASYVATQIETTDPNTIVFLATCGNLYDTTNPVDVPTSDMGVLGSTATFPAELSDVRWEQMLGAAHAGGGFIVRVFAVLWSDQGPTGSVTYESPGGSTTSTSILVAFREPG